MAIVFANGVFDILHCGHFQLLNYCRYLAGNDDLIIAIDSDAKVKKDKGSSRPYYTQAERENMLMMLTKDGRMDSRGFGSYLVSCVEVFDTNDELYQLIHRYQPDYIVKGDDWKNKKVIGSDLATVHFSRDFFKDICSTSEIERRVRAGNKEPTDCRPLLAYPPVQDPYES